MFCFGAFFYCSYLFVNFFIEVLLINNLTLVSSIQPSGSPIPHIVKSSPSLVQYCQHSKMLQNLDEVLKTLNGVCDQNIIWKYVSLASFLFKWHLQYVKKFTEGFNWTMNNLCVNRLTFISIKMGRRVNKLFVTIDWLQTSQQHVRMLFPGRCSYIICKGPCKMKMWSPLFKSFENFNNSSENMKCKALVVLDSCDCIGFMSMKLSLFPGSIHENLSF